MDGPALPFFCRSYHDEQAYEPSKKSPPYQLFFHMMERFINYNFANPSQICSFPFETGTWKPAWYILQDRKRVYQEGSRNPSFSKSIQCYLGERDIGVVRVLNVDSIYNLHTSSSEYAYFQIQIM